MTENVGEQQTPAPARHWNRPRTWILFVIALPVLWFVGSLALLGWNAQQANSALSAMSAQIAAGDPAAAADSIESARSNAQAAQARMTSAPISALNVIPYFRTNLEGAGTFLDSAASVLDAASVTNDVYATLSGSGGTGQAAFQDGTINLAALESIEPQIEEIGQRLTRADAVLQQMPPDISGMLRGVVDEAQAQIDGIQTGLQVYTDILPDLPTLLGEDQRATYLVVFHNPGELYPGGGAALNAAVMQFDKGRMEVIDKGEVNGHFFPGNPRVAWDPVAKGPYYPEQNAKDGFAWSNLHQDYRITGEDMMRSWVANGGQPIDGVISLDPVALQAAVAVTGPIQSDLYGEINADNLVSKLFYEGYNEDPEAQKQRHEINQQLIDEMLSRMQGGTGALSIGRAIFSTAPGQHIRIHLSDNRLQKVLREARADGAQPDPEPDRIAFYTQNQNASKVDIFQTRLLIHDVDLDSDGSARVIQTAKITNNAPDNGTALEQRISYTTRWAFHWNIVLLPEGAQDVRLAANPGEIRTDERVFTDVDGRTALRVGRWIPPGESSIITVSYRLPDGTFGTSGNLEYRAGVEHQLTTNAVDLTVNVTGPSEPTPLEGDWNVNGDRASTRFPVSAPTTLALGFGDR